MNRVRKALPKASVRIDQNAFRQEINDLLRDASALQKEQELLRAKAFSLGATKESLSAQVQMAKASLRDIEGDLKYLTETQQDGKLADLALVQIADDLQVDHAVGGLAHVAQVGAFVAVGGAYDQGRMAFLGEQ